MTTSNNLNQQTSPVQGEQMTRHQFLAKGSAFALAAAVTGPGLTLLSSCGNSGGASSGIIRIGWVQVLQWTHWADISSYLEEENVQVELTEFGTTNDALVALTSDSIDMSTIGYNHMSAALADRDTVPLTFVAGVSSGGSRFVAREDANIESWEDLKGKRLGSARNSTQDIQLVAAAQKHGIDLNEDVQYTNLGSATDMNVALRNGDVDMIMSWEANASDAIVQGYGVKVPAIQDSLYEDSFKVSSGIAASDAFIEERTEQMRTVLRAYHESWQKITSDEEYWLDAFSEFTTFGPEVLQLAANNAFPEFGMDQQDVGNMANLLYEQGIVGSNVTEELIEHMDYEHISEVSDQSPRELGKNG